MASSDRVESVASECGTKTATRLSLGNGLFPVWSPTSPEPSVSLDCAGLIDSADTVLLPSTSTRLAFAGLVEVGDPRDFESSLVLASAARLGIDVLCPMQKRAARSNLCARIVVGPMNTARTWLLRDIRIIRVIYARMWQKWWTESAVFSSPGFQNEKPAKSCNIALYTVR